MNFLPEKIASINKSIYPFGYTLGMKGLNVNVIKILMYVTKSAHAGPQAHSHAIQQINYSETCITEEI